MSEAAPNISEGAEFARAVAKLEDFCEAISDRELPRMARRRPNACQLLGRFYHYWTEWDHAFRTAPEVATKRT
jgi:hypothetical protein